MCRIFGVSFGPDGWEADGVSPSAIARIMAPALVAKGPHAYGYMQNIGGEVYYDKWSGRPDTETADENLEGSISDSIDTRWLVGHTRWATHGSPEDNRNNHPLQHGNVIGVHNGVLVNHEEILEQSGRQDPKTEVDSEAIFASVHMNGHRAGLRAIVGQMVTVYTNLELPDTLHVGRSYGRDLFLAHTKGGSIIFASEMQAIKKTGIEIVGKTIFLKANTLMRLREGLVRSEFTYRTSPPPAPKLPRARMTDEDWEYRIARLKAISNGEDPDLHYPLAKKLSPPSVAQILDDLEFSAEEPPEKIDAPPLEIGIWDDDKEVYLLDGRELKEAEYIAEMMDRMELPF